MSLRFAFIAGGIFSIYFVYSILQERLLKGDFSCGDEKEKFTFVLPLLFVATFFNYGYALAVKNIRKVEDAKIPTLYVVFISLTYFLAMVSSFMALKWVSYPAQVVAKSAKPIPVLVMGVLIGHKTFPARKYTIIFLIVTGVVLFLFRDDKAAAKTSEEGFGIGEVLLIMSLLMDGLCNSMQERLMAKYKPNSDQLMAAMNKWSILFAGTMILLNGEGLEFFSFIYRHPSSITQIVVISICGALGQFFIFLCLTEYGTLTCSVVTTTRKFFTVLASVIFFGHILKWRQWFGVLLVFTGLFLDTYYSKKSSKKPTEK